jgi:glycosyltransferase involved in cell wall biosynthesis
MKHNKRLKIAIVSDAIYPYNKGGKEKKFFEVSIRLAKAGYDIHIYTMKWWKGKALHKVENGVHLHAISPLYNLYSGEIRSIKEAILFSLSCLKLIREDFDVIDVDHMPHLVLFPVKLVCLIKRKQLIASWNEVWGKDYWIDYMGKVGIIASLIEYISVRLPDKIISISSHTTKKLATDLGITKHVYTIPMGISFKEIEEVKPSLDRSDIIFAGRLLSHKHVDTLIKAIAIVQKSFPLVRIIIVGDGPEKARLEQLARKKKIEDNISFYGYIPKHSDLYALFKGSKLFVFPSTREGFGIAVLEANACRLPVITINHPDNASKNLITEGINGYLIQLNEESLAIKILEILNNDQLLKKLSHESEKLSKKYDWDSITQQYYNTYLL